MIALFCYSDDCTTLNTVMIALIYYSYMIVLLCIVYSDDCTALYMIMITMFFMRLRFALLCIVIIALLHCFGGDCLFCIYVEYTLLSMG